MPAAHVDAPVVARRRVLGWLVLNLVDVNGPGLYVANAIPETAWRR